MILTVNKDDTPRKACHSVTSSVKNPTCASMGSYLYVCTFCFLLSRVLNSRLMVWKTHVKHMAYTSFFFQNTEYITWVTMCRWEANIAMNLGGTGCEVMDYIQIVQNIFHLSTLVNTLLLQTCFGYESNFSI
jgi:hypothetical protein